MIKERLISVIILSGILIWLAGTYLPKPDDIKVEYNRFWTIKTHSSDDFDVVIMGDSRAYRGISPYEFEEDFPDHRVLNFGYSSGGLNELMFKAVEEKLSDSKTKKIIVIAITPNSISNDPKENGHYLENYKLPREEIYERLYFAPLLRFFSAVTPEDLIGKKKKKKEEQVYHQIFHDNGWVESHKTPEDTTEAFSSYRTRFETIQVTDKHLKGLMNQVNEWTEKDYLVVGFRMPSSVTMENIEDSLSGFDEVEIRSRFKDSGGKWIETNSSVYHSYDGSHLHKDSAKEFSRWLAGRVKELFLIED